MDTIQKQEPDKNPVAEEAISVAGEGITGIAPDEDEEKKRSAGNKAFDAVVYPATFLSVYGLSTWAIKAAVDKEKGGGMNRFYERLAGLLEKGAIRDPHNMARILISFGVGTALMVPVKLLEDARGKISRYVDRKFHGASVSPHDYAMEPKQSWRSVMGGRLATFLSVLGIGALIGEERTAHAENFITDLVEKRWMKNASPKRLENAAKWIKANAFEMFYTAVCTVLVYVFSRAFARKLNERDEEDKDTAPPVSTAPAADEQPAVKDASWQGRVGSKDVRPQAPENFVKTVDGGRSDVSGQHALG